MHHFKNSILAGALSLSLLTVFSVAHASEPTYDLNTVVAQNTTAATPIESQEVVNENHFYLSDSPSEKVNVSSSDDSATINKIEREDGTQIVIEADSNKDSSYNFQFKDKHMRILPSGHVLISAEEYGEPEYVVDPAWAVDAAGNSVPTWYEVHRDTLTQVIKTSETIYDVVADPYYRTAYTRGGSPMGQDFVFSKDTTRNVATGAAACAAIVAPFAPWVAAGCGGASAVANHALSGGNCLAIRRITLTLVVFPMSGRC